MRRSPTRAAESRPRGLCLLAYLGQLALGGALLLLQAGHVLLACFQLFVEPVQRGLLRLVLDLRLLEGLRQRLQVQAGALGRQRLAAAVGLQRLPVQVVHAGALDLAGTRGLGRLAAVGLPALLPVGQRRLGFAQRLLLEHIVLAQLLQPRLRLFPGAAQRLELVPVVGDVLVQFAQRAGGLVAGLVQAAGQFALVLDLLLDAGEHATDLVDLGLGLVQRLGRRLAAHAPGLDLALGLALAGDDLLELRLFLGQPLAQGLQLHIQRAELQRLPLRVLDLALGGQRLVLLGLAGLAAQVLELLVDLLAQVVEAIQVLAGVADAGLGLLAPLLVLGDAGGLFQVHAQVLGPGLDDLADHALLDDRVAARAQAGAEEQVGDVAAAALGAVEVVVALAVAADQAPDRDFVEGGELAADGVVAVVEDQFDRGLRDGLARRRAGEDHVGQRIAAQAAGRAFAHHPAHRVDDVGLAAAVGADHAGHVGRQVQRGGVDEGLEAGQLDRGQAHAAIDSPGYAAQRATGMK